MPVLANNATIFSTISVGGGIIDVYHAIIGKCLYKLSKRDDFQTNAVYSA